MTNSIYTNEINWNQIRSEEQWIELLVPSADVRFHLINLNQQFSDSEKGNLYLQFRF